MSGKPAGASQGEPAAEVRKVARLPSPSPSLQFPRRPGRGGGAARAPGRGARTMAAAPAPARAPARRHYRVQLRFVTEEQLFAPGPLSPPTPKSLRLEVHPAGEEADATVTDGEVLGAAHPASPARKLRPVGARGRGAAVWQDARGRAVCEPRARGRGAAVHPEKAQPVHLGLYCCQRTWTPRTERPGS